MKYENKNLTTLSILLNKTFLLNFVYCSFPFGKSYIIKPTYVLQKLKKSNVFIRDTYDISYNISRQ